MSGYDFWVNTQIDIQTALDDVGLTLDSVTKASPAVMHWTSGVDPVTGDYVVMTANGMIEVNGRAFRLASVDGTANTAQLEGVDSTNFNTFTGGLAQKITFGVSMTTVQDVNSSGGDYEYSDLTTIHDSVRKRAPTVSSPLSVTLGCLFKPEDPAHLELFKANTNKTLRVVRVRWPSGRKMLFLAYVGASGIPTGSAQEVVKTNVSFEGQGLPVFYAT